MTESTVLEANPELSPLWTGVDQLIDRAPSAEDLRVHRLQLLAARRFREVGREVPRAFVADERIAARRTLAVRRLLERIRAACDGPIMLIKGPEIAARYPDAMLRPYTDIDIVVPDAQRTQRELTAAGFEPVAHPDEYYERCQHLRPVVWPGLPLHVEVHRRPNWIHWSDPPSIDELLEAAVPSSLGVAGVATLPATQHALLLAAHAWGELPLRRLLDLVDVETLAAEADPADLRSLAAEWDLAGVWATTISAADALLLGAARPRRIRTWAKDLDEVRDRTVLENHLRRWCGNFWALSLGRALWATCGTIARELGPASGETWAAKLARTRMAIRHAFSPTSIHHRELSRLGDADVREEPARKDGPTGR